MDTPHGILVQSVLENGAASKADVKEGDVILSIDGREVNQPNQLQVYIASKRAGDEVTLKLFRDKKEIERKVTLKGKDGEANVKPVKNDDSDDNSDKSDVNTMTFDNIGLTVENMTPAEKKELKVTDGILISEVKTYSSAYDQNLRQGWAIVEVNKKPINSVSEFDKIVKANKGKAILVKLVNPEGTMFFTGIDIPE
jgi:serine protease Do